MENLSIADCLALSAWARKSAEGSETRRIYFSQNKVQNHKEYELLAEKAVIKFQTIAQNAERILWENIQKYNLTQAD